MKLIIKKDILMENLNHVSKAISSKNLIPVLSGIKFELNKKGLYLSASDNDISIQVFIDKKDITTIEEEGSVVIGGKYITEIVRKLPSTDISIEVTDGVKMMVSTKNSEFNLNGINANEFPNLYLEESKEPILLENSIFKNIINQTFFATSANESRPLLTGINFKLENNSLEVIATDSYRLAKKLININTSNDTNFNIVIPCRNLLEISKILMEENNKTEIHIFNNKILFKYKNILFQSRLLNGNYPASSNIIPTDFALKIDMNLTDLYDMIDRASLLTSDRDKNTIRMELGNKELVILSNSPEIGKVEERIGIEEDFTFAISFSSKFMIDALKSFNTKRISIYMNNDSSPIVIKSDEEKTLTQLILPIKTY